ncbi:MAG: hypothetical protein JSW11_21420 [Candidatus Heimdallarchaeota archaeon]|nr:MAG: hypothetical protein JSW11_21420 [Candidatus Heimdallarchaeota archaeon]
MNQTSEPKKGKKDKKKKKDKPKGTKRTFRDNMRQLKFNLTTIRANTKLVLRLVWREIKYYIPLQDLFLLFFWIGLIIGLILILIIWGAPLVLGIIPGDPWNAWGGSAWAGLFQASEPDVDGLHLSLMRGIFNETTVRYGAGIIGTITILVRAMIKSPIAKYRDKVNTRKGVTYVFGTSRPAEQFLFEMISQFGYEERVSLIADVDLLWIRSLMGIDIYVVENQLEFAKPNLYDIIGFKNASRVMILTESIELNQNILTNIRRVRPDVEIILLSQYAPAFVFSDLVQDENLIILEDLDATIQGLVHSLSLDFDYPPTVEIDVPRTYIGSTGVAMSSDLFKQVVLLIRRGKELLSPTEELKLGDRVVIYFFSNYYMKLTNRVVTELPLLPKKKKEKKSKKKKKKKEIQEIEFTGEETVIPTIDIPVVGDSMIYDSKRPDDEVD